MNGNGDELQGFYDEVDRLHDHPGLDRRPVKRRRERSRPSDGAPVIVRLSDVVAKPVEWLLDGGIPVGSLSLLAGDPGEGKTTLALDIAARVSTGRPMPAGPPVTGRPSGVVILTAEDSLETTIRPRLDAHGGDPNLVVAVQGVREQGHERHLDLGRDLAALEEAIDEVRARLVIIDPLSAYLGKTNSWQDSRTRDVLTPAAKLAERRHVAILGLMHLTKASDRRALYRLQGTVGFVAAARVVMLVGTHPEDGGRPRADRRRVLVFHKVNNGPERPSVAFRVGGGPIEWCGEVDVTADDLSAPPQRSTAATKKASAERALAESLADGEWHPSATITDQVRERVDCGVHVVRNAAASLGVERKDRGWPAVGWMRLADTGAESRTTDRGAMPPHERKSTVGDSRQQAPTVPTATEGAVAGVSPVRDEPPAIATDAAEIGLPPGVIGTELRGGIWRGITADGDEVRLHARLVNTLRGRKLLGKTLR